MVNQEDLTVQSICSIYMGISITAHPQQLSIMLDKVWTLVETFNKQNKYAEELKILNSLFFTPIDYLKKKYAEQFKLPKHPVDWNTANIEWALFRSTRFATKLGKEFIVDTKKATESKSLLLSDLLTISYLFKRETNSIFNKILVEEKINLHFDFGAFMQQQKGGVPDTNNSDSNRT